MTLFEPVTIPHNRITPDMGAAEVHAAMSEMDVGAADLIVEMIEMYPLIEPNIGGVRHYFYLLDYLELYGENLYLFWKDVCGSRTEVLIAVLRFYQMGKLSKESVVNMNHNQALTIIRRMAEANKNFLPFTISKKMLA